MRLQELSLLVVIKVSIRGLLGRSQSRKAFGERTWTRKKKL